MTPTNTDLSTQIERIIDKELSTTIRYQKDEAVGVTIYGIDRAIQQILALVKANHKESVEKFIEWGYGKRCEITDKENFPDEDWDDPKNNRCPTCEQYERLDEYLQALNGDDK